MKENIVKKLRVLVVDDQVEMRKSVCRALKIEGHEVLEASDGISGLEIVKKDNLGLIISDLRMPEMDGLEFLQKVKKIKQIPFILMTGFSQAIEATEAYKIGVDGFLQKPFQNKDLLNCIADVIAARTSITESNSTIESAKAIAEEFCGIPIAEFMSSREIQFPIFLKLSDNKFVKIALCGEDLSSKKIDELKIKGISLLYLLREDFKAYISYAAKITESILANKKVALSKKAQFLKHASEMILTFGFQNHVDQQTFDLAKLNVEQSLSLLTDSEDLFSLMNALTTHSIPLYAHSMGVAITSSLTAKAMNWGSSPLFFRLVAGSIFHDLGKKDFTEELLNRPLKDMSKVELDLFRKHSDIGADLLSKVEDLPAEIVQIVRHHHELCDGSGYPEGLSSTKIHPVAKVIGVSDEFFKLYRGGLGNGSGMSPKDAILYLEKKNKSIDAARVKWEALPALKQVFQPLIGSLK